MTTTRICVTSAGADRPLIDVLASNRGWSRRKAKALLDRRAVFVNGRRTWMAHHLLKAGDAIDLPADAGPSEPGPAVPRILYQDDHCLVADKPAGLLANGPHSLETRLRAALGNPALAAVHRLDRGTSGCLLFAKNAEAQERLFVLFKERKIHKLYRALVSGPIREPRFTITRPIAGQTAVTDIQVLETSSQASHLQIAIHTGRTHQIRKHLLAIGHPLLGDPYYATRREVSPLERRFRRPMLHAFRISFRHPVTGATVRCEAPVPADFRQALAWLRLGV